ncbi:16S rRNA (cytosine(967)-C(5))-methyltransferase RsmB [Virgibacillus sp. 179-BFC.A HS]|uniref:16S rRNA (cytosine(967)-C(5))-methyltransferase n=1 Tax=Tigheibacillus jepli TaxID=3035914 RepID=A0ABU5CHU5_9BACI|nr:16S rRNA (cytosine(967)-C(5))-methyltransferase RsmB [Virgibacillus sp. 179-BFC.A HS]MDY0405928.1 16S rRNA (cytosine(967)-C(5))-methyltransferase RsmB [Virgibacillus sp. 179-BFC.A HS]
MNDLEKYMLRKTILELLLKIDQGGYSHLLIDHEIKAKKFSEKDVALLTEIVYGTIQRKLTLDFYLEHFIHTKKKIQPWVWMLLRMSVYQMVYLDKVPDHAVIHEAVEISKQRGHKGVASFVNGVLRNVQRKGLPDISEIKDDAQRLSIETSHPLWLVENWIEMYGYETTKKICIANLQDKPVSIRIQPMRIEMEDALAKLKEEGYRVRRSRIADQGIVIEQGNILKSPLFKNGFVTIQDQSSMLAGIMLDPKPGMTVLDACSAPGGKATHLAELMENSGKIHAHDLHPNKIKEINKRAEQLQLTIIDAKQVDARN